MSMLRTLISLAAAAMLINLAKATSFTVGGPTGGWDTTTNMKAWASSQTFLVGDSLTFPTSPFHNVLEVSKADYDSCQNSNPIQLHSGGSTPVPLISPGRRYFICGVSGHCSLGMKVEIVTLAASAASPAPLLATPIPAADSPLTPLASSSPTGLPAFFPVPLEPTPSKPLTNLGPTSSSSLPPSESSASYARNAFSPPEPSSVAKVRVSGGSMLGVACFMMVLIVL